MKIESISIKGWRSFDSDGITISALKRINILIGSNNSGKSNISKYFLNLKEIIENKKLKDNKPLEYDFFSKILHPMTETDTWIWGKAPINCEIALPSSALSLPSYPKTSTAPSPHFCTSNNKLSLKASNNEKSYSLQLMVDGEILLNANNQIFNFNSRNYIDFQKNITGAHDTVFYWKKFLDSLVFIDPIRHYSRDSKDHNLFYFNGAGLFPALSVLKKSDRPKFQTYLSTMTEWISQIIGDKVSHLDISTDDFDLTLSRGKKTITGNLSELGTGVSQIVILLSHLYLRKEDELNVFMDEPESNLHPDAVVKLVNIFENDFKNHNFFITTHSPVLIDQITPQWSVHRVLRNEDGATKIYSCENVIEKYGLLDDLGIRASQILQSNMVVWVEGPSDAIYLKKWIDMVSGEKLIAGRHYSFLFYGGSNLTSHTICDDEYNNLVDFLNTSRYVAIFCDSDCKSQDDYNKRAFKSRVTATLERVAFLNQQSFGRTDAFSNYVKIWLTHGRETENYVPTAIFSEILLDKPFRKIRFKDNDTDEIKGNPSTNSGDLIIDDELKNKLDFGLFDSFDEKFSSVYKYQNGQFCNNADAKNIAGNYANNKVKIAKAVVAKWREEDFSSALKTEMTNLVEMIKRANGI